MKLSRFLDGTFSAFGDHLEVMMGLDTGNSRRDDSAYSVPCDASGAACEAVDGQYLRNRPIAVFTVS